MGESRKCEKRVNGRFECVSKTHLRFNCASKSKLLVCTNSGFISFVLCSLLSSLVVCVIWKGLKQNREWIGFSAHFHKTRFHSSYIGSRYNNLSWSAECIDIMWETVELLCSCQGRRWHGCPNVRFHFEDCILVSRTAAKGNEHVLL